MKAGEDEGMGSEPSVGGDASTVIPVAARRRTTPVTVVLQLSLVSLGPEASVKMCRASVVG
jgi:hypothetical protein